MKREDIESLKLSLELPRDEEDYYLDAYGKRISFKGIRTLKKAYTKLPLTRGHVEEIIKCADDFEYFRDNYCIILTKTGYGYIEQRDYQKRLCDDLLDSHKIIALWSRQSGKCTEKTTLLNVKNTKNGIPEMSITSETLHNIKLVQKYSYNKPRKNHNKITINNFREKMKDLTGIDKNLTDNQIFRLTELFEVINCLGFKYKPFYIKSFLDAGLEDNFILRICNIWEYNINNKGGDTKEKLLLLHGDYLGLKKWEEKSSKLKGELNPAFNHGGTLSPFSDKSLYHSKETRENVKEMIRIIKIDPAKRSNTTIEYWLQKGFTIEESKDVLKDRQSTFSLKSCIEKYGDVDGLRLFKERQDKWQCTMNSKSYDEISIINKKRGKNINAGYGVHKIRKWGIEKSKNTPGILYYIRFFNKDIEFWKIGVTKYNIEKRFGDNILFKQKYNLNYEILEIQESNWYDAFIKEQTILKTNTNRIRVEYNGFSSSECFYEPIKLEVIEEVYRNIEGKI